MATLHLIGGEKGGTGKSLVTRTVAQYHLDQGIDFALFDADHYNPDVKRIYGKVGCQEVIFSEAEKYRDSAMPVYLAATKKTTIVNLPPQIMMALVKWFKENRILEMAKRDGVVVNQWFVSNGEYHSLKLFGEHLSYFQGSINHVLVKNLRHCEDWKFLESNDLVQSKIREYDVKLLDFPELVDKKCLYTISQRDLTWGEAREYEEFDLISRSRISAFLEEAHQRFDEAGVFDDEEQREEQLV